MTSRLVYAILKLNPTGVQNQNLAALATYLKSHESAVESPETTFLYNKAANSLANVPIPSLESHLVTKGKNVLKVQIVNILNEELKGKSFVIKGSLFGKKDGETISVGNDISFVKKGIWYEAESKDLDNLKPGIYKLVLSITEGKSSFSVSFYHFLRG